MTAPLPPYPPRVPAWRFPPPPIGRRWFWLAILGPFVAAAILVTSFVGLAVKGSQDFPATLDDPDVLEIVEDSCDAVHRSTLDHPVVGSVPQRLNALNEQNGRIHVLVERLEGLQASVRAGDEPLEDWLDDWRRLLDARQQYAVELESNGHAHFDEPTVDGEPITERMNTVTDRCQIPAALLHPDTGISLAA